MLEEAMIKWREQARQEGQQEGQQEGRRKGRQEGRREALREGQMQARREMLLELLTQRFGRLPAKVRRQVEEISSIQELRKLGRKVQRAKSLEEMGLR